MSCCTNKREEVSGGASSSVPIYQSIPDEESLHSISTTPFKGGGPAISLSGSECHEGSSSTTTTCRDVLTRACSPIFSFFFHHNVIEVAGDIYSISIDPLPKSAVSLSSVMNILVLL
eukprot:scaffold6314_cov273-Ochromonas_danica.AAC.6